MTDTPDRTESVFASAVALASAAERAAYLDQACAGDAALRDHVEALLRAHERAGHLLDRPAPGLPTQTAAYLPGAQPGVVIAGRYKLLEEIGEGGMGSVWVAEQTEPVRRKVALKLVKAGMDSKAVLARFEAERQALAVMDHPNIAKVLDGGLTDTGRPFFVMEYVKGVPITQYCDAMRMSVPLRLELFTQICSAVQHAHQKGIIHRDLKPSNILVAPYDDKPVPKVIDFGLAKAMNQSLTEKTLHTAHETVLGTPLYMSPEQAQLNNLDVDTRSDIYSLGVLLYELLTGTTPLEKKRFKEAAWDEVKRIIREEEPPRPSARLSSTHTLPSLAAGRQTEPARLTKLVRGELDWIVMRALEKDRTRRYETANGFATDIQRYLAGEPVQAAPPSARYRLRKFARKHRTALTTTAALALLLVVGVAVSAWQALRARRAEAEAWQAQLAERERAEGERRARLDAQVKQAEAEKQKKRAEVGEKLASDRLRQVEAEKKKADEEKQVARAVKDFLQRDLLAQADTKVQADALLRAGQSSAGAKLNPTIRELLDRAARELAPDKIEANFPKQPLVQAELLRTIGTTYSSIGEHQQAIAFLNRAEALCRKHLGAKHPSTLVSTSEVARAYGRAGQIDKAVTLGEDTLERMKATLGPEHPSTLTCMNNLGTAYLYAGQLGKAVSLHEDTLKVRKAALGPGHPDTLDSMHNLAFAYNMAGQIDKALALVEDTLKLAKATLGPEHPDTLRCMEGVAASYWRTKQLDKAIPLFQDILKHRKEKLGRDHRSTLNTVANLGTNYKDAGRFREAIPLLEEAYKAAKKHPNLAFAGLPLIEAYAKVGEHSKLANLFKELLAVARTLPRDSPQLVGMLQGMNEVTAVYWKAKQFDKSIPLTEETLKFEKEKLGRDHLGTLATMAYLGLNYKDAGRLKEAISLLEEAYKAAKKHPTLAPAGPALLDAYAKAGEKVKFAQLLKEQLADARALPKDSPQLAGLLKGMSSIAVTCWEAKQLDRSIPLFEGILKVQEEKFGRDDSNTLRMVANLGINYKDAGRLKEAIPLLEQTHKAAKKDPALALTGPALLEAYAKAGEHAKLAILLEGQLAEARKTLPRDSPQLAGMLAQLGLSLLEQEKWSEAEPVLRECLTIREKTQPDAWMTFNTQSMLGGALLGQKKYADAEPLLLAGYEGMKKRQAKIPLPAKARLVEAAERLVHLYEALGKKGDVVKWREELDSIKATQK
jgi:tetratricopeptide (TPR) repeat protein